MDRIGEGDEAEFLASLEGDDPERENHVDSQAEIVSELQLLPYDWRSNVDISVGQ